MRCVQYRRIVIFALVGTLLPHALIAPVAAQDGASTPIASSTPVATEDRVSKSFQFYPADGQWGDYFDLQIEAGASLDATALIANTGETTNDLRTYAIDAYTAEGGGFAAAEYGTPPNDVTSWLDYPEESFAIAVGQGVERTFTVTVPAGTAPGQYITAIAAANAESGEVSGSSNFAQITRYVIPVFISVPGPTTTAFEVGEVALETDSDLLLIRVPIHNTGDIRVRPTGTVELLDQSGNLVTSFPVRMESIYARDETILTLGIPGSVEADTYQVRADLVDPDTNVTTTFLSESLAFEGSGEFAERAVVSIISAIVAPAPAADDVQFANVEAVIANGGEPVANAQLSLIASVNGDEVERFPISQSLSLPTGDTPVTTRYIPATGWTTGDWTFELLLETVEPSGAAVVVGSQPIDATITIP